MFVCNIKFNPKILYIIVAILVAIFLVSLNFIKLFKIKKTNTDVSAFDYVIDTDNFADTIKNIHDNMDANINKRICIKGFVFRMPDFNQNYFVCGRNIIIDGEDKVAGILCEYSKISEFEDGEWIEVCGIISKGQYLNPMPVIRVENIKKIPNYEDSYVTIKDNKSI